MPGLDVDAVLRWFRFEPQGPLRRRGDEDLPFVRTALGGPRLLLDTCVYVDRLRDRLPEVVDDLLERRLIDHSMVAIQELMHAVAVLDPKDRRTPAAIGQITGLIRAMPAHRVFNPDPESLAKAALLAGLLARTQSYGRDQRLKALADCTLLLQARKHGMTLLTRNIAEFDLLLQLIPDSSILFYRAR